jgi:hypothetical protein
VSKKRPQWDLDEVEVSKSSVEAALSVVRWLTQQKDDVAAQWATAIRLAQRNGASLREIGEAANVAPQTVSQVCKGSGRPQRRPRKSA